MNILEVQNLKQVNVIAVVGQEALLKEGSVYQSAKRSQKEVLQAVEVVAGLRALPLLQDLQVPEAVVAFALLDAAIAAVRAITAAVVAVAAAIWEIAQILEIQITEVEDLKDLEQTTKVFLTALLAPMAIAATLTGVAIVLLQEVHIKETLIKIIIAEPTIVQLAKATA